MSNESFDNKIKGKFENFEPTFQEQDWQNFAPLLHPKIPFWLRIRKPLTYALAASTLLFLTFQNYQQSIENKQLHSDIQTLRNEKQQNITTVTQRHDTVYLVKEVLVPSKENTALDKVANTIELAPKSSNNRVISVEMPNQQQVVFNNPSGQKMDSQQEPIQQKELKENQNLVESPSNNTLENNITTKDSANTAIVSQEKETSLLLTLALPKEVKSKEPKLLYKPERELYFSKVELIKPKHDFSKFAIGLSANRGEHHMSFGLAAAYSIGKHLEINSGVEFAKGGFEDFKDNDDFRKKRNVDFKQKFNQPLPPNVKFSDIHAHSKQIIVPIALYYKIPLHKYIFGVASIGTALTVSDRQNFDYQYSENGNAPVSSNLEIKENQKIFHNAIVSAGIQSSWKHFTLRAEPNYSFNFNRGFRQNDVDDRVGIKTQLYYTF